MTVQKYPGKIIQKISALVIGALLATIPSAYSQTSITGPTCVIAGTQYNYTIAGNWNTSTNMNWYQTTGTISGNGSGTPLPQIHVTFTSSGTVRVTTTNPSGSATLNVTVTTALSGGTLGNTSQNIISGNVPASITNSTAPSGGYCSPTYTYQWQQSTDNVNFTNISGATSLGLSFSAGLTQTTYYRRMVTETYTSGTAYSNTATVYVYPALVPGNVAPSTQTIPYNTNASLLTLSGVSGGTNSYTYQWQQSTDGVNFSGVSGATASTYTPTALATTTFYRVMVSSGSQAAYTSYVAVYVDPQLLPGVISPNVITITGGSYPGVLSGSPAGYGSCSGSYTYQWFSSANGTSFTTITGATSATYTPGTLTANTWYTREVTCGSATAYTDTVQVVISSTVPDMNFIRVRDIKKSGVTDSATAKALTSPNDVAQTTQYFDGLGRIVQTVAMQQTPLQKDLVSYNLYDAFGREVYKYLPYVASTTDGNYKATAFADGTNFNKAQFPNDQFFYSQSVYEGSPLNRVTGTYPPGNSWAGSLRGVEVQYLVNTASDSVRIWNIAATPGSLPASTSAYPAGTLFKTVTTDEAGHQTVEYKDKDGSVVLKKVQLAASPGTAHVGWLCTYYVYDDLDNLRFVIQPQALVLINSNWVITTAIANELCFRYEYDERKRMVIKKIPGAGETWMVHDARDRLVMTQDSSLRSLHKWLFTQYDSENRPDSTGLITDPTNYNNRAYHQNLAGAGSNYPVVASYTNELLTQTYYDDYSWVSGTGSGLSTTMATNYTSNSSDFNTNYNASPVYSQRLTQFNITRGMITGAKTKVVGSASQFLYDVNFYDDRGRTLQTQSVNYTGGIDTSIIQYSFDGKPLSSLLAQKKNGNNAQAHKILTGMTYDAAGRLLAIYKNIDNASSSQLIATNTYNELGQLSNKALGNSLENLAYTYNIRGWLASINKGYLSNGTGSNYFGMELGYDNTTAAVSGTSYTTPEYNGNISGTIWRSKGDGIARKYDFLYDNANRLTSAAFLQNTTGSAWDNSYLNFTANNLSYDANGNILTMNQYGFKVNGSALIDQLTYTYQTNSNKLSIVNDAANNPISLLGDFHYSGTKQAYDYSYDGNGNLILDNNKAISAITYNYLNLPNQVTVTAKGTISYTYDAGGNKLLKTTVDNTISPSKTTTTLYLGGTVYQNDTLQFISHEEGRARWALHKYTNGTTGYGFEYDYFLKDHLGNTRMVLTQEKDTAKYMATMEAAYRTTENQLFYNIPQSSYPRASVAGYPTDNTTSPNDSVARVNGSGQDIGPSIILKVMSGDVVDIACKSYWVANGNPPTTPSINNVLNSLANGIEAITGGSHGTLGQLNTTGSPLYTALNSFITNSDPAISGKPKAYLNWILLDDQFNYVNSYPQSGAIPVSNFTAGTLGTPGYTGIPITKSGYLYIYVSNESQNWDVFFDNLTIQQRTGPITEETHFYPFGLSMAGISDKAAGGLENRYKYNGIELDTSLGLDEYEASLRDLDPQIGRWWQVDPETEDQEMWSPYTSNNDNPIFYKDPRGNEGEDCCGGLWDKIVHVSAEVGVFVASAGNAFATNQVGGAGRSDPNGWSDPDLQSAAQMGATTGDGLTVAGAIVYDAAYGTGTIGSGGTLALTPATTLALQQTTAAVTAIKNLKNDFAANNSSSGSQNRSNQTSNQSALTKPPKGKGKVPPSERDPQRLYTRKQKQEMLDRQNGRCASCGEEKTVDEVHGHHDTRHADGGRTRTKEGHAVCKTCHVDLHR